MTLFQCRACKQIGYSQRACTLCNGRMLPAVLTSSDHEQIDRAYDAFWDDPEYALRSSRTSFAHSHFGLITLVIGGLFLVLTTLSSGVEACQATQSFDTCFDAINP